MGEPSRPSGVVEAKLDGRAEAWPGEEDSAPGTDAGIVSCRRRLRSSGAAVSDGSAKNDETDPEGEGFVHFIP